MKGRNTTSTTSKSNPQALQSRPARALLIALVCAVPGMLVMVNWT